MKSWPVAFLVLICLALFVPAPAFAQAGSEVTMTAQAGFDGYCKEGLWLPVRVSIENQGSDIQGQLQVRAPNLASIDTTYSTSVSLPGISHKEITVFVHITTASYPQELQVSLVTGKKTLARAVASLNCFPADTLLFGLLVANATPFNGLTNLSTSAGKALVARLELKDLPDKAQGLESLTGLVISGVDTGSLSLAQRQALEAWITQGGHLFVAGGPDWQKTAAGLGPLLPLAPTGSQTLPSINALESLAFKGTALLDSANTAQNSLTISQTNAIEPLAGSAVVATGTLAGQVQVIARQGDFPLVTEKRLGHGDIFYLAADPALPPLKSWNNSDLLFRVLLAQAEDRPGWANGITNTDLAMQAASSLPGLGLPSFMLICGFLFVYLLAIGPLNYFLLRRLRRSELAWVSIPVLVISFSCLAFIAGSLLLGTTPVLSRLAIVQVDADSTLARVDGVVGLYSPSRSTFQLQSGDGFLLHPLAQASGTFASSMAIQQDWPKSTLSNIRLEGGSMQAALVQGQITSPAFTSAVVLTPEPLGIHLKGSVTNQSSQTLKDAVLLAPGVTQSLGNLKPGETRSFDLFVNQSQPLPSNNPSGPIQKYIVPPGSYTTYSSYPTNFPPDDTISAVIGSSNYYSGKEIYRRYALFASAYGGYNSVSNRGSEVFLTGWVDGFPGDVSLGQSNLLRKGYKTQDTTLYLVHLPVSLHLTDDRGNLTLLPGMFSWAVLDNPVGVQNYSVSPYRTDLSTGSYSLNFILAQPILYDTVDKLILHLNSAQNSTAPTSSLIVSLWNQADRLWEPLAGIQWGDNDIPDPARYVGPGGSILLKITNSDPNLTYTLTQTDFTLIVKP